MSRDIKQEVEQFLKIVYSQHPGLESKIQWNLAVSYCPAKVFDLDIRFPSQYRDQILSISKFCGIYFVHEYHTFGSEECVMETEAQFF